MDLSTIDAEIAEFEAEAGDLAASLDSSDLSMADVDALLEEYEAALAQGQGGQGHSEAEHDTAMVS